MIGKYLWYKYASVKSPEINHKLEMLHHKKHFNLLDVVCNSPFEHLAFFVNLKREFEVDLLRHHISDDMVVNSHHLLSINI